LMSYVMRDGDTVQSLASRFGVSMDSIEQVNGILNPDNVTVGGLYYIPLDSGWSLAFSLFLLSLFF
jgi:spore germination protein YaaH